MRKHRPAHRTRLARVLVCLAVAGGTVVLGSGPAPAAGWQPKEPPLTTPWTGQVSPTNALPEYPRPQLTRRDWRNLNGVWQFSGATNIDTPPVKTQLGEAVLVPYPIESALSGIKRHENYMWYRRTFTVPLGWVGRRVKLNFGAANWETRVWVNGVKVGTHTGGYDSFGFDITRALRLGSNEIIAGVYSPVEAGNHPIGKQRQNPNGFFYTASSGIWQTVWLEPVNAAHITRLDPVPDVSNGVLDLVVHGRGISGQRVRAEVRTGNRVVGSAVGAVGAHLRIPVPKARLWSPDDPFLYDLRVSLTGLGGGDTVGGYFGMRSLGKAMIGGMLRPTINGKFVYQLGTLDQGYWPDGAYTAPTDAALRSDLEQQKALGFNMVRKHIKVEPARWYYHADRLGLLVWQDMPSLDTVDEPPAAAKANFEAELVRVVDQLKGFTSIVQWIPFNEGWGEFDAGRIADLVKRLDPSRLVNHNSGVNCCSSDPDPGNGDVIDDHIYNGPGLPQPPSATRVAVLGEYGGMPRRIPGHEWSPGAGFGHGGMYPDEASLTARYVSITAQLRNLITTRGLSGSVYTQPYDVENEVNGFYTYDRRVVKMDAAQVIAVNRSVLAAANGTYVPVNELASLRVITPGATDRYLRHLDDVARTDAVAADSPAALKQDATFWMRPGLADAGCFSFESRDFPGHFLRHAALQVRKDPNDGSGGFAGDATFCARAGLGGGGTSFESRNLPGHYLRHHGGQVYLARSGGPNPWDDPATFAGDATWSINSPWWRSAVDLPVGETRSLRVTTPGLTDRYVRHLEDLARTDVVTADSPDDLKQDATFWIRPGLADASCYSFEARNFPGHYLRHAAFRVHKHPNAGSNLFARDATFCAQPGPGGAGTVALASDNMADGYLRHYAEEVWVATSGGPQQFDNPVSFPADISWAVAPAWAP